MKETKAKEGLDGLSLPPLTSSVPAVATPPLPAPSPSLFARSKELVAAGLVGTKDAVAAITLSRVWFAFKIVSLVLSYVAVQTSAPPMDLSPLVVAMFGGGAGAYSGSDDVSFTPLHVYYIAPPGSCNDANLGNQPTQGTGTNGPKCTPNFASLVCGDIVSASVGTYDSANLDSWSAGTSKWGTVGTCPSVAGGINNSGGGVYAVNLVCATPLQCNVNGTTSFAMYIDKSNWAITGWTVSNLTDGNGACVQAAPLTATYQMAYIGYFNSIATNCTLIGFFAAGRANTPAFATDEVAMVGLVSVNAAQSSSFCGSGFGINTPHDVDALAGTHVLFEQLFSFGNINGACSPNSNFVGSFMVSTAAYPAGTTTMVLQPSYTGAIFTPTFTNGSANIGYPSNSLLSGSHVAFQSTGALPTGFTAGQVYYVIATGLSSTNFQLSATLGGSAIVAGSAGSGTQTGYADGSCMPQCFGANWPIVANTGTNGAAASTAIDTTSGTPTLTSTVSMNYPNFTVALSAPVQAPGISNGQALSVGTTTDGNGLIFDTWASNSYTGKTVARNAVMWGNGSTAYEMFCSGTCSSSLSVTVHNLTGYGNAQDYKRDGSTSEFYINDATGAQFTATDNLMQNSLIKPKNSITVAAWNGTTGVGGAGSGQPILAAQFGQPGLNITGNWFKAAVGSSCLVFATCDGGNNIANYNGVNYASGNTLSDPGFANPGKLPTPTTFTGCAGYTNVVNCMNTKYGVYDAIRPTIAPASKGYQRPGPCVASDSEYPIWIKGLNYIVQIDTAKFVLKSDLSTKQCGM